VREAVGEPLHDRPAVRSDELGPAIRPVAEQAPLQRIVMMPTIHALGDDQRRTAAEHRQGAKSIDLEEEGDRDVEHRGVQRTVERAHPPEVSEQPSRLAALGSTERDALDTGSRDIGIGIRSRQRDQRQSMPAFREPRRQITRGTLGTAETQGSHDDGDAQGLRGPCFVACCRARMHLDQRTCARGVFHGRVCNLRFTSLGPPDIFPDDRARDPKNTCPIRKRFGSTTRARRRTPSPLRVPGCVIS